MSGLIAVAGDNLRVSEGGPTIGEALYDAGFEAGESFADILNPTLTVEDVIGQVADVVIDDTSVNSGEPNEQFINDDGIQYRIETVSYTHLTLPTIYSV